MDFDEDPNYLDIDDILAQTKSVSCTFLLDIPGLEFLWPNSINEAKQNEAIDLPFWLAKTMYAYSMIDIKLPEEYSSKFRDELTSDPNTVDLHKKGPYYYEFGKMLMNLRREKGNNLEPYLPDGSRNKFRREEGETFPQRQEIAACLMNTFHTRRHNIISMSMNKAATKTEFKNVNNFKARLDKLEENLYQVGLKQNEEFGNWMSRKIELINNNAMLIKLAKKRKIETSSSQKSVREEVEEQQQQQQAQESAPQQEETQQ